MRSLAMCEAILAAHEGRVRDARSRHLEAVRAADKALAAELRRLETIKASAAADKVRIVARSAERHLTSDAPFVLRKMGEFYTKEGHWVADPDEMRHHVERYLYRAAAERQANMYEWAEVRTWAQYRAECEERNHRPAIGPKPTMPDADAHTPEGKAAWAAYEAASLAWDKKKFLADAK